MYVFASHRVSSEQPAMHGEYARWVDERIRTYRVPRKRARKTRPKQAHPWRCTTVQHSHIRQVPFEHTCLCLGFFGQMTYILPLRHTILHPSQSGFTDDRTFIPRASAGTPAPGWA